MSSRVRLIILGTGVLAWVIFYNTCIGAPTPTPAPPSRDALLQTVAHIQRIAHNLEANLEKEKEEHSVTDANLIVGAASLDRASKDNAALQKQIQTQTDRLNGLQDKYDKQSKILLWYRLHFYLGWAIFITGVIACVVLFILKVTGRLAILGATVASKIP
jgi:hypothetical protein